MGVRGPKPLPPNVHRLRGNPSKRPMAALLDDVVRPDVAAPKCPDFLGEEAKREWRRIVKHLLPLGLLAEIDLAALTNYCTAWGDLVWSEREIAKQAGDEGQGRISRIAAGSQKISAVVSLKYLAMERVAKYAAEFGMSPSARSRVSAGDPQLGLPGIEPKPDEGGWATYGR